MLKSIPPFRAYPLSNSAVLTAWSDSLDGLVGSIQAYHKATAALHRQCSMNYCLPPAAASGGTHIPLEGVLSQIDKKLVELRTLEELLHSDRTALQQLRNQSIALAPIHRLPPEILAHIFAMGLDTPAGTPANTDLDMEGDSKGTKTCDTDRLRPAGYTNHLSFLRLTTQVCRHWRDIAIGTPRLWTIVDFSDRKPFRYTKLLLERSRQLPLKISLKYSYLRAHSLSMALDILRPSVSDRRIDLNISMFNRPDVRYVLSGLASIESPPRIDKFTLLAKHLSDFFGTPCLLEPSGEKFAECMRGVTRVDFRRIYLPWESPVYTNLVELRLYLKARHSPKPSQLETILRSCPGLGHLDLGLYEESHGPTPDGYSPPASLEMNSLRNIRLHNVSRRMLVHLMDLIRAPALETLYLSIGHTQAQTQIQACSVESIHTYDALAAFLHASAHSLRDLSLQSIPGIHHDELDRLLQHLSLSALSLLHMDHIDYTLLIMALEGYCPELESLVLEGGEAASPSGLGLFQCLRAFISQGDRRPLQRLTVRAYGEAHFHPDEVAWLRARVPSCSIDFQTGSFNSNPTL
ncbi:hypothetical protein BOTBODRAFT_175537 [Botryobasidium botryosum FD-172 SS1]|uniref:Uncharacterized protein n=1 Tax=Botryobasidium botryosum (strain FD-172 SS1) TaxID=930990 RepID=A0A067MNS5_BOTB1|nr:hypothetical protein BOTBODRAFT_175537 [Botryobasidium botryosum FD-172 SS1]